MTEYGKYCVVLPNGELLSAVCAQAPSAIFEPFLERKRMRRNWFLCCCIATTRAAQWLLTAMWARPCIDCLWRCIDFLWRFVRCTFPFWFQEFACTFGIYLPVYLYGIRLFVFAVCFSVCRHLFDSSKFSKFPLRVSQNASLATTPRRLSDR